MAVKKSFLYFNNNLFSLSTLTFVASLKTAVFLRLMTDQGRFSASETTLRMEQLDIHLLIRVGTTRIF